MTNIPTLIARQRMNLSGAARGYKGNGLYTLFVVLVTVE